MPNEKKPRDSRITLLVNSPQLIAAINAPEKNEYLALHLDELNPGESLAIPLDIAHEPTLRVRVSRENAKRGKVYRLIKHGAPHWCYEIGCLPIVGNEGEPQPDNVSRETSEGETEAEKIARLFPNGLPPPQDD